MNPEKLGALLYEAISFCAAAALVAGIGLVFA